MALGSAPAALTRHYLKWVPAGPGMLVCRRLLFAILGIPGLPCRSEQSSPFVCSFTGPARSGTRLARSGTLRHASGTLLARVLTRHVGSGMSLPAHLVGPYARWPSSVACYVVIIPRAYPGVNP